MENQAVELIGLKQQAVGLLYGEETGGLSTLKSASGGSLLAELAAEIGADKTISDLGSLFARHAQTSDPAESAWFTEAAAEDVPPQAETEPDTLPFLYASVQGFITLTAIHPDGKRLAPSRHLLLNDEAALGNALECLHEANTGGWGAYVSVATRKSDLGRWRRGTREEIIALPAVFVDIDENPEAALDRLRNFPLLPSCVVHSGHGLHAYWFLAEPMTEFDLANRIRRGLAGHFDGDSTNAAHMLRLPGSVNTKPARAGALCHVVEFYPDRRYSLSAFTGFAVAIQRPKERCKDFSRLTFSHNLNPALVKGIADRLLSDYRGHIKANGYIAALCPCGHCRDYPGSHFNFDPSRAIGTCFGRHGRLLLKDLCELLRFDPVSYGGVYA
jgi:hypothetical protein